VKEYLATNTFNKNQTKTKTMITACIIPSFRGSKKDLLKAVIATLLIDFVILVVATNGHIIKEIQQLFQ